MGRGCIGICNRYEITHNREAYSRGFKYCARCRLFIQVQTIKCPCCTGFLRTKSHQSDKSKIILVINRVEWKENKTSISTRFGGKLD